MGATSLVSRLQPLRKLEGESSPSTSTDEEQEGKPPPVATEKLTLEEKMKAWEASEEEIKASTLGGVVPGRSDAFDLGLYIAFPFLVLSSLLFVFFPLIVQNFDISSVGPPPTS